MTALRLLHVQQDGVERPAVMYDDTLYDATGWCDAWTGAEFAPGRLSKLRKELDRFPTIHEYERIGSCVKSPTQILAIGLNYSNHVTESQMTIPLEPVCFTKSVHSLSGPNDNVVMPKGASKLDWEVELAIVMGEPAYQVDIAAAKKAIGGYCLANDISERSWQLEREGQWLKGKSSPTFCPLGPWVVPAVEMADAAAIDLSLAVNGKVRQHDSTASMLFSVPEIVSTLSQYLSLFPGDVILTGTPEGVGMATQDYLAPGDHIEASGTFLGSHAYKIVAQST